MANPNASRSRLWAILSTAILLCFIIISLSLKPLYSKSLGTGSSNLPQANQGTIYRSGTKSSQSSPQYASNAGFPFTFRERLDIESLDPRFDEAWNKEMNTPLGGFMLVAHNESFYRAWGVSMFHSIHCLTMLRMSFQRSFGLVDSYKNTHGGHSHGGNGKRDFVDLSMIDERQHVEHCLGYIGRALLCNGDDTLEPPIGELDEAGNVIWSGVSGADVEHTCRDSSLVWQKVAESEKQPLPPFEWSPGDTIRSVFG